MANNTCAIPATNLEFEEVVKEAFLKYRTNQSGVPPALPGRQSNFENSGSISRAVALAL